MKELNTNEIIKGIPFFSYLDGSLQDKFAKIAFVQDFQNEETIMLAGDTRRIVFFMIKGQAKIISDFKNSRNNILNLLHSGDFFGETQFLNDTGKTLLSVKAKGRCTVMFFKGKDFINEVINIPKLNIAFLKILAQKISSAYMQISYLSIIKIKPRIRACLMQLIESGGVEIEKYGRKLLMLRNIPTQQQLAEIAGTARETVNRELVFLKKNKYIEFEGRNLILLKELFT